MYMYTHYVYVVVVLLPRMVRFLLFAFETKSIVFVRLNKYICIYYFVRIGTRLHHKVA